MPDTIEQSGIISVKSKTLAPIILPADNADCFLTIAVIVVTSSGSEVPTATIVTPIILSETLSHLAISLPLSTSKSAPTTIAAAPTTNLMILII